MCWVIAQCSFGQSMSINNDGSTADQSAILDVKATNKGMLTPRMTKLERDAIPSPANSLLVFQTNADSGFYYYNQPSNSWLKLVGQTSGVGSCQSVIPQPLYSHIDGSISTGSNSNTTAYLGKVFVPLSIRAQQISFYVGSISISGRIKLALYSEDGQQKVFEVTSDTLSIGGLNTINLSSAATMLNQGFYYIVVLPLDNARLGLSTYYVTDMPSPLLHPPGKDVWSGELAVIPNTLPASFNPTNVIFSENRILIFRLDL